MSRAIKREPNSPICVVVIGIKSWLNCLEKLSFLVVDSHCLQLQNAGKHILATTEFQNFLVEHAPGPPLGGKALRALPILCLGVKLSCPPVQNLNEPPGIVKITFFPKVTKMGSIIGHRIDYNGVGALRGQRHISTKINPSTPPGKLQVIVFRINRCPL